MILKQKTWGFREIISSVHLTEFRKQRLVAYFIPNATRILAFNHPESNTYRNENNRLFRVLYSTTE
jgi:hypothetical protein